MKNNPTASERQLRVASMVARYQRKPSAVEHERLLLLIENEFGPLTADFFDQEGCLPLNARTGPGRYPWPMQQQDALLWGQVVFLCGLAAGGIISWGLTSLISVIPALIIGAATGIAVWFVASPVVGRLFPPKDLLERQRLVQAFVATQERHQRAREAEAEGARQSRQFRRIVEDDLSG